MLAGCASAPVYKDMFKEESSFNTKVFPAADSELYPAVIKALCLKNFIIEREDKETGVITAKRSYQQGKKIVVLVVQARIVPSGLESTLFLNGLQTTEKTYVADKTRFFLWIIPLPGGGGKDATSIKEGEKVIEDKAFYQNFFSVIEQQLAAITPKPQAKIESPTTDSVKEEGNPIEKVEPLAEPAAVINASLEKN